LSFLEAREVRLRTILSNNQEAYAVPIYQRPYAWERDQWEDLLDDVTDLKDTETHFLGSVVVVPEGEHRLGVNRFQVVDGQQRLATLLIWLAAIRDSYAEAGKKELADHISDNFLVAKEWKGTAEVRVPKLELGKQDTDAFSRVLNGGTRSYQHQIFGCYDFFKKETTAPEVWQKLLDNVYLVHINAFTHFNAFRLFETLNDRGLELSAADLIKNFLLMKVSNDDAIFTTVIADWNELYEKVANHEPVKFIRRYSMSLYKGKVPETRLYETIRSKYENESAEAVKDFVTDLNSKASVYKKILDANFASRKISEKLRELALIEVAPSYTLLLRIIPSFEEGSIEEDKVVEILRMIETFHIRWGVCGQSTAYLDQIYNDICMELPKHQPNEYDGLVQSTFSRELRGKADDTNFEHNFTVRSFKPSEDRTKYILWKLSKPTGETTLNLAEVQTEHIMPQTLDDAWKTILSIEAGNQLEVMHQEYLNKIGNLTLIKGKWNESMSNGSFDQKKVHYVKSEFATTKELASRSHWGFKEIGERSGSLAKQATQIWGWT
jgi:hypothetical protein